MCSRKESSDLMWIPSVVHASGFGLWNVTLEFLDWSQEEGEEAEEEEAEEEEAEAEEAGLPSALGD